MFFLSSQGIVDHIFSLDDACNLANSESFAWSPCISLLDLLVISAVDPPVDQFISITDKCQMGVDQPRGDESS